MQDAFNCSEVMMVEILKDGYVQEYFVCLVSVLLTELENILPQIVHASIPLLKTPLSFGNMRFRT